jgi:hypothetical protein
MLINEGEFRLISNIELERDQCGHVLEERPTSRYNNPKGLSLNRYGNGSFCRFRIEADNQVRDSLGVYAIVEGRGRVLYIGKYAGPTCTFGKRFNAGYGTIHPGNCYVGGQSINCRINRGVLETAKKGKRLRVVFRRCQEASEASNLEAKLIQLGQPPWNKNAPC